MADKKTYYINLPSREISRESEYSTWDFKIEADEAEIIALREYMDREHAADEGAFYRAHVPYLQYHFDRENDAYDDNLIKIYGMLYELGDESAKEHIKSMGIIDTGTETRGQGGAE